MGLFKKGTKLYSIVHEKCPHCHEGEFFVGKSAYRYSTIGKIHEKCPHCGEKYSKEPGFYYGAMYVAYGLGVALFVAITVGAYVLYPDVSAHMLVILIASSMVIFGPKLYHQSKIIWANLFFQYKGNSKATSNADLHSDLELSETPASYSDGQ